MGRSNEATDVFALIDMRSGSKTECWPWKGTFNEKDKRPYFTIDGRKRPAAVVVLEQYSGEPADGRVARHSCDKGEAPTGCCSPYHLLWGSHQDNMDDMKKRERHGLPRIVVRAIQTLLESGQHTHESIGDLYGISREAVTAIANGRTSKSKSDE